MPVRAATLLACLLALCGVAVAAAQTPAPTCRRRAPCPEPQSHPARPDDRPSRERAIADATAALAIHVHYLISAEGIPDDVDSERFFALAESQGERWGHGPAA